ncbi:hypothetical protein [Mycoplasma sp. Mirounga ES2805-ORL]|uniref:hypothetical protein n=1 Tax=Mycoplasma sp. Mirounga ES2805-ORL TaxID=754514 RepID=UPI00197C99B1|nr:hypothetical protein [Mycoplasma sp. Mirounga ES2805-ORL]QSF13858.1 hypothetical protein JXZ90_00970 [Mycoplasma sp. Mirounga ES2805-ORL]
MNNGKLTNKSFWLDSKDNSLIYNFLSVKKVGEKYFVTVEAKFVDWVESPVVKKDLEITFDKLGIEKLNEMKIKKGQQPISDIFAPSATLNNEDFEPDLSLENFVDTDEDNQEANYLAPQLNKAIKKIDHLYCWDEELLKTWKDELPTKPLIQTFNFDDEKLKNKTNLYFFANNKYITDEQIVYVFSKPKLETDNRLSVKVTLVVLQDFNANTVDKAKCASKRIIIDESKTGEKEFDNYVLKFNLDKKIANKEIVADFTGKEEIKAEDIYKNKDNFDLTKLVVTGLSQNQKVIAVNISKNSKNGTLKLQLKVVEDSKEAWTTWNLIEGFKQA